MRYEVRDGRGEMRDERGCHIGPFDRLRVKLRLESTTTANGFPPLRE